MGREKAKKHDMPAGGALLLPLTMIRHPNWLRMSRDARALIVDLGSQYTGYNNGFLCCSMSLMKKRGWASSHTLRYAMLEAEYFGFLIRTQQGSRDHKPNLHALSWRRIDAKPGRELEVRPTLRAPDTWQQEKPAFVRPKAMKRAKREPPKAGKPVG